LCQQIIFIWKWNMRPSDRLFQIVNFLQGRKLAVTAREIAGELGVCERTIYRDMNHLSLSGVPVRGEAGVGYMLDGNYHLPPLVFDVEEIETLVLGAAMVGSWSDEQMAGTARRALDKIRVALPDKQRALIHETALFAPDSPRKIPWMVDFSAIRRAVRNKNKLTFTYTNEKGERTERVIRPLAMAFFAPVWLLLGW
jgi:predicted DNA-binding transcriptional regulator YafY